MAGARVRREGQGEGIRPSVLRGQVGGRHQRRSRRKRAASMASDDFIGSGSTSAWKGS
jgi:hypothetical protein